VRLSAHTESPASSPRRCLVVGRTPVARASPPNRARQASRLRDASRTVAARPDHLAVLLRDGEHVHTPNPGPPRVSVRDRLHPRIAGLGLRAWSRPARPRAALSAQCPRRPMSRASFATSGAAGISRIPRTGDVEDRRRQQAGRGVSKHRRVSSRRRALSTPDPLAPPPTSPKVSAHSPDLPTINPGQPATAKAPRPRRCIGTNSTRLSS
jgi:hypothetical protein